jgi:hypothetical protein
MKPSVEGGLQQYDLPTAITFLMAGLGIGSLVTILLSMRAESSGSRVFTSGSRVHAERRA